MALKLLVVAAVCATAVMLGGCTAGGAASSTEHGAVQSTRSPQITASGMLPTEATGQRTATRTSTPAPESAHADPVPQPEAMTSTASADIASLVAPAATTCRASQFVLGRNIASDGMGGEFSRTRFQEQQARNSGPACVFALPRQIAVQAADGVTRAVDTVDAGYSAAYTLAHGQTRTITIGDSWINSPVAKPGPCLDPLYDIRSVIVPLHDSDLRITVTTYWAEVCTTPASTTITMDTGYQPARTDGAVSKNPG